MARAGPFEVDGPLDALHPALLRTPRHNDLRRQPTIDSLSVARLLLANPIKWSGLPGLTDFYDRLDTRLDDTGVVDSSVTSDASSAATATSSDLVTSSRRGLNTGLHDGCGVAHADVDLAGAVGEPLARECRAGAAIGSRDKCNCVFNLHRKLRR